MKSEARNPKSERSPKSGIRLLAYSSLRLSCFRFLSDFGHRISAFANALSGGRFHIYFDHYAAPYYYGAVKSDDMKLWRNISAQISFPRGVGQGLIFKRRPQWFTISNSTQP
jgi:hypothetical protein